MLILLNIFYNANIMHTILVSEIMLLIFHKIEGYEFKLLFLFF